MIGVPEVFLRAQDFVQKDVDTNLNVVYHRKFICIDGERGFVGSANIGECYQHEKPTKPWAEVKDVKDFVDTPSGKVKVPATQEVWHDGLFYCEGELMSSLNHLFASQWYILGTSPL